VNANCSNKQNKLISSYHNGIFQYAFNQPDFMELLQGYVKLACA